MVSVWTVKIIVSAGFKLQILCFSKDSFDKLSKIIAKQTTAVLLNNLS